MNVCVFKQIVLVGLEFSSDLTSVGGRNHHLLPGAFRRLEPISDRRWVKWTSAKSPPVLCRPQQYFQSSESSLSPSALSCLSRLGRGSAYKLECFRPCLSGRVFSCPFTVFMRTNPKPSGDSRIFHESTFSRRMTA